MGAVSFVLHCVEELLGPWFPELFTIIEGHEEVHCGAALRVTVVLVKGGDFVVVAVELGHGLGSVHVADEELDVAVVEVEDLVFGHVATLDVVALVLDNDVRTFKLGVELVRLVLGRVETEEDEFARAVDVLVTNGWTLLRCHGACGLAPVDIVLIFL